MARKVNTKFVFILVGVMVLLAAGLAVAYKVVRTTPEEYIAAGEQALAEGRYQDAIKAYGNAAGRRRGDISLVVKLGDIHDTISSQDRENFDTAEKLWHTALQLDPNNRAARERLFNRYKDVVNVLQRSDPGYFQQLREAAQRLLAVDPDHAEAEQTIPITYIQQWLSNIDTDAGRIDESIQALEEIYQNDPGNETALHFIARAKMKRAAAAGGARGQEQLAEVQKLIDDAAAAQPKDVGIHHRAAQIYAILAMGQRDVERRNELLDRAVTLSEQAVALAEPDEEDYASVRMQAAALRRQRNDFKGAEQLLRELVAAKPEDQTARLELAALLSKVPAHRDEAITLLTKAPGDVKPVAGARGLLATAVEDQKLILLTHLRLDTYNSTQDPGQREQLLKDINSGIERITRRAGADTFIPLHLKGKKQLYTGDSVAAVVTLSTALNMLEGVDQTRLEILDLLAKANINTNQTGEAKQQLREILKYADSYAPAHLMMAQLLIRENKVEEARPHVEFLRQSLPEHPDVIQLTLATMDREKDKQQIEELYARLPEQSRAQKFNKVRVAAALGRNDDAIRLMHDALAENPSDKDALNALVQLYMVDGQKEQALAVLDQALQRTPGDHTLVAVRQQIENPSPEQVEAIRRELAEQIPDALQRALAMHQVLAQQGRAQEAARHLQEAEKINSDHPQVLERLFADALAKKDWEAADRVVARVARANADQAQGRLYRYRLLRAQGQTRAAHDQALALSEAMPQFAHSWLVLAQSLHEQGRFQEAMPHYLQALQKQNNNADAFRGLIECSYQLNRPQEAKRYIDQAVSVLPNAAYFHELAANHEMLYGDPEKILEPRLRMVQQNPDNANAWLTLGQSYFAAAKVRSEKGDEAAVKQYMTKARETFAEAVKKWPDSRQLVTHFAELSLLSGEYESGLKALQTFAASEGARQRPDVAIQLAEYLQRDGRLTDAENVFAEFLAQQPDAPAVQIAYANLLAQQNKLPAALAVLERGSNMEVKQRRIELLIAAGRIEEAERSIADAMKQSPGDEDLQVLLAYVYLHSERTQQAVAQLDKVIAANPRNAIALYNRALVRLRTNSELQQAARELATVRDILPNNMEARYLLAEAHQRQHNTEAAIQELEAALRAQPAARDARLRLAEIYAGLTPPRWLDVERVLRDGLAIPQLSADPELIHAQAIMWNSRGDAGRAHERIRAALEIAPQHLGVIRTYSRILMAQKNYRQVIDETRRLLAGAEGVWWAHVDRAVAHRRLNEVEQAQQEFQAALNTPAAQQNQEIAAEILRSVSDELGVEQAMAVVDARAQQDPSWRLVAAQLYARKQDWTRARAVMDDVMSNLQRLSEQQQITAARYAGDIYLSSSPPEYHKARQAYLKFLEKAPNDIPTLNNLACLLILPEANSSPDEALVYSQRAFDQMRARGLNDPMIYDTHGWVLVQAGRVEEGLSLLHEARRRQEFVDVLYHLGEAYLKLSPPQANEAERFLLQAQQMVQVQAQANRPVDPAMQQSIESKLQLVRQMQQNQPAAAVPLTQ